MKVTHIHTFGDTVFVDFRWMVCNEAKGGGEEGGCSFFLLERKHVCTKVLPLQVFLVFFSFDFVHPYDRCHCFQRTVLLGPSKIWWLRKQHLKSLPYYG